MVMAESWRLVRPVDVIVAIIIGAVVLPLSLLFADERASWLGVVPALLVAGLASVAMIVAIVLARGSALLALGIAWGAALVQIGAGLAPLAANLAVLVVLFWTGFGPELRVRVAGGVSAGVAAVVVTLYLQVPVLLTEALWIAWRGAVAVFVVSLVSFALAWTLGLLAATVRVARAERQEALAEQERGRIAREMHDVVAHSLAVIIAQADGARYASADDPEQARAGLVTVSSIARSALGDVRALLAGLRHREAVPQPTLDDLDSVIDQVRAAGLAIEFQRGVEPAGVPIGTQLAVHRIVQEALTNVLRHGRTDRPTAVTLGWRPDEVTVFVGSAIDPGRPPSGSAGHGITGMRERARIAGGTLTISTSDRFELRAVLPFEATVPR